MPERFGMPMISGMIGNIAKKLWLVFLLVSVGFAAAQEPQTLRVGLGYLPDVQFAPFYTGVIEGLYAAEGLDVEFQHGFVTELYPLLSQDKLDFVVGDAEDVIALKSQDAAAAPFTYLMALYQQVPNALFSLSDSGIESLDDLKGKKIGIPGLFGTSYTSLQAMLEFAGLSESDITLEQIGFTQVEAVLSGRVDVAMGFLNNEPIILANQGISVNVIAAGDYNKSAGNGVITTDTMLENAELVQAFLRASQEAMALTIREPETAFEASKAYVENLGDDRMEVLMTSIELYTSDFSNTLGIGFTDPLGWETTLALLQRTGRVETDLDASAFYTNDLLTLGVGAE